jgi:hydrogenase maturation protease
MCAKDGKTLILGVGNILMGDEGLGVHVIRHLETMEIPGHVECLDGGTGGPHLLEPIQRSRRVILIDATADGGPAGTVRRLEPRFSREYPRTLTAHDIGLKDLIDAFHLLGEFPEVVLYAVSIEPHGEMDTRLSPELEGLVPDLARAVLREASRHL